MTILKIYLEHDFIIAYSKDILNQTRHKKRTKVISIYN
jgi:hypothetical protein